MGADLDTAAHLLPPPPRTENGGRYMREGSLEPEGSFAPCSGGVILGCKECGERLVLIGLEEEWRYSDESGTTGFECGCGEMLSLDDDRFRWGLQLP